MLRNYLRPLVGAGALCLCFSLHITTARAQSAADLNSAAQQSGRIQREQQQRQQEDIDRSLEDNRPPTEITVTPPPVQHGHGQGCIMIRRIEFNNTVHMTHEDFLRFAVPTTGRCMSADDIQTLLSAVTRFYVDKGYATTRVYLPAQDLSTGTLQIKVVAGKISALEIAPGKTQISHLQNIFPGLTGDDLNLRDLEQGIDQLNRLTSNNATLDLQPGAQPGDSIVVIKNNPTKFWHANITADNYGTESTGRNQIGATASLDNVIGLNEFISATQRDTVPIGDSEKQAKSTSALFSIPFGYTTFTAGYTGSNYNSTLSPPSGLKLPLTGDDRSIFATIDDVVYRGQTDKASVNISLTNEKTDSYLSGEKINVSSRTITSLSFGANYQTTLLGGSATLGAGYDRGLNIFDALDDSSGLPGIAPRAEYNRFTMNAGYVRPFSVQAQNLQFSTQFSGQYAPDALYSSQQMSIGGMYSVRGFFQEELANDDGYFLRNDLTLIKTAGTLYGNTIGVRPYVAFDVGSVASRNNTETPHGTLGGTAIGLDLATGPVDFTIYTGYPVIHPTSVTNERFNTFGRLSVTF